MPIATYQLFRTAMLAEQRVTCLHNGRPRELCPVILGHSDGEEKVLAYQVGGSDSAGAPVRGARKCLRLAQVRAPCLGAGEWREGRGQSQTCVRDVDLDINIHVRKRR